MVVNYNKYKWERVRIRRKKMNIVENLSIFRYRAHASVFISCTKAFQGRFDHLYVLMRLK